MLISVILFLAAVSDPAAYACGDDQVRELRLAPDGPVEVWRWTARDAQDLPADYRTRLMAHIDAVQPGRVHRVIHEELLADPEGEVRALLSFLDQPFEEACLSFHANARAVRTASSEQVRRPINRDGVDQWRPYDAWLGPLKDALGPVLAAYPSAPANFG